MSKILLFHHCSTYKIALSSPQTFLIIRVPLSWKITAAAKSWLHGLYLHLTGIVCLKQFYSTNESILLKANTFVVVIMMVLKRTFDKKSQLRLRFLQKHPLKQLTVIMSQMFPIICSFQLKNWTEGNVFGVNLWCIGCRNFKSCSGIASNHTLALAQSEIVSLKSTNEIAR